MEAVELPPILVDFLPIAKENKQSRSMRFVLITWKMFKSVACYLLLLAEGC